MAHPELSFQDGHREYSPQVLSGLTRVDHQDRFTNLSQLHVTARTSAPAQSLTARRHMTSRPMALPHHEASIVPRRGATCYNSAPEGRIKQDPRLFSKRLLFQEKNPVTTEIIQYKIHQ